MISVLSHACLFLALTVLLPQRHGERARLYHIMGHRCSSRGSSFHSQGPPVGLRASACVVPVAQRGSSESAPAQGSPGRASRPAPAGIFRAPLMSDSARTPDPLWVRRRAAQAAKQRAASKRRVSTSARVWRTLGGGRLVPTEAEPGSSRGKWRLLAASLGHRTTAGATAPPRMLPCSPVAPQPTNPLADARTLSL